MSAKEITYEGLKELNKTSYLKLFKKPVFWKKASGVIFLAKYQFSNGKIPLVAIPFRKYTEAAKIYKDSIKKDFGAKLIMLATIEYVKGDGANLTIKVTPRKGGIGVEFLATTGKDLFSNLNTDFIVDGSALVDDENANSEGTEDQDDGNAALVAERMEEVNKINKKVSDLEKQIGKQKAKDLIEILLENLKELEDFEIEAQKDGLDKEEEETIKLLKDRIEKFKDKLQNILSPEQKQKAVEQVKKMTANVGKMLEIVNKAIGKVGK